MENLVEDKITKKEDPSRWWMLYHAWAGICLKAYFNVSGLFMVALGEPDGTGPGSSLIYSATAGMLTIGIVLLGYHLSKLVVKIINASAMQNKGKILLKSIMPIAYFIGAVSLSMVTSPLFASSEATTKISSQNPARSKIKPVLAFTIIQDAEGVKESDLGQNMLKNLEAWIVQRMLQKAKKNYAERGYNPDNYNLKYIADSVYVNIKGKKLAVIKINMGNIMRSVVIIGIKGNEMHKVSCIRASNHDIPVWSGECGKEVQYTFGVNLQQ